MINLNRTFWSRMKWFSSVTVHAITTCNDISIKFINDSWIYLETGDAGPFLQCSYIRANLMVHVRYRNGPLLGLWQILLFMQSPTVGVKVCIGIAVTNVYRQEQAEWKCPAKPLISVSLWSCVWTLTPSWVYTNFWMLTSVYTQESWPPR